MSQSVTLNGSSFTIPDVGDEDWGQDVTDYLVAIPGAVLQKSGGSFTLTAEVNFGATYGLKTAYYKSQTASPASAGQIRLAVSDTIKFRNNLDNGDLAIAVDAADALTFGGNKIVTVAGGFTTVATNSYANQKGIRFMEQTVNGVNYVELVAPDAVTANVTLKLPDGVGTAGQVLSTDGTGVLSWIAAAGGGTVNTGLKGYIAVYSAAGTTIDDVVTMTNTVSISIAAHGQGTVYSIQDCGAATADLVMTAGAQTIGGAKTLSGVTIISNNSTAAFSISQASSFKVDSTNALVSIGTTTMTYPLYVSKSSAGANVTFAVENSEAANAASHARIYIITGGASSGDPFMTFYNGVTNWSYGSDNSDSDALCWTGAATLNGTNLMRLTTAGALTIASTLTVTAGGITVTAGAVTIAATTNQVVLGTTNTVTITSPAPASSAVYTIPDVGTVASFILTTGAQTITGAKTFASSTLLLQEVSSTDVVTIAVAALAAGRTYTIPDVLGAADFVMTAGAQTLAGVKTFTSIPTVSMANPGFTVISTGTGYAYVQTGGNSTGLLLGQEGSSGGGNLMTGTSASQYVICGIASNSLRIGVNNAIVLTVATTGISVTGTIAPTGIISGASGSSSAPSFTFASLATVGMYFAGGSDLGLCVPTGGSLEFRVNGTQAVVCSATNFLPVGTGTVSSGTAANYWNDISYKTITDRGCLPWCDEGVELCDGRIVSDLEALIGIKKHAVELTIHGLPKLDYSTFPKKAYRPADSDGKLLARDKNNLPIGGSDGVEMTMMFGVFIGAFKEIKKDYLDVHAGKIQRLEERVEKLELKAA